MTNDEISRYMTESNNTLGEWQVVGLAKIAAFYKDRNLHEMRQAEIREKSHNYWEVSYDFT